MIYIAATGMLSALGGNADETVQNLAQGTAPGMHASVQWIVGGQTTWVGAVLADLPPIPSALAKHHSRNNQLILAALKQIQPQVDAAISRYGRKRVAVVVGTSSSGLDEAVRVVAASKAGQSVAGYHYQQQELGDTSRFISDYLGLQGPCYTISTACSSSARAIISGARLIEADMADVVIAGGADTLNAMSINGFNSLEATSSQRCTPFAQGRDGINIGEGVALMLLTREPHPVALLGAGESGDAWHMSAPHPEGLGARQAIERALQDASLQPEDMGYINLHGTATILNDAMESQVIHSLFGEQVPCSSTKHLTGHTLGAAGCVEAVLSYLLLTRDIPLPAQDFSERPYDDHLLSFGLLKQPASLGKKVILSNSFAFGGNNACLIFGVHDG